MSNFLMAALVVQIGLWHANNLDGRSSGSYLLVACKQSVIYGKKNTHKKMKNLSLIMSLPGFMTSLLAMTAYTWQVKCLL